MCGVEAMMFLRPRGGLVLLGERAADHMLRHRQTSPRAHEAGGVLLGRMIAGSNDLVIDVAHGPTEQDKRTRFSFFRDRGASQAAVDRAWVWRGTLCNRVGWPPVDGTVWSNCGTRNAY